MATKNPQSNPSLSDNDPAPFPQTQAQSTAAEPEHKRKNAPGKSEGTQFFDTTIAKYKTVKNADGDDEEVVVMSDHLDDGEELKSTRDERTAAERAEKDKAEADKDNK